MINMRRTVTLVCAGLALWLSGCKGEVKSADSESRTKAADVGRVETKVTTMDAKGKSSGRSSSPTIISKPGDISDAHLEADPTTGPAVLVHGRITFADGTPATSATVSLMANVSDGRPGYSKAETLSVVSTDENGSYKVRGDGETYSIWLQIEGDLPTTDIRDFKYNTFGGNAKRSLTKFKRDVILARAAELKGRVINEKNEPMPNLPVQLKPIKADDQRQSDTITDTRSMKELSTTSTATGDFVFDQVADGQWIIGTMSADYAPVIQRIDVPTTDPVTLQLAAKGGTVEGRVLMKKDSSAVPGIGIRLVSYGSLSIENKSTTSSQDGTFKFDHISSGSLGIAIADSYSPAPKLGIAPPQPSIITLADGETTDITLLLYAGHTITGMVYDKDTSEPLSGAKISAGRTKSPAESNAEGRYTINNVFANGDSNIYVALDGYKLATGETYRDYILVNLPEDSANAVTKDLPMVQSLTISGKVVTKDGTPVGHAMVNLVTSANFSSRDKKTPVNSDGTFKLEAMPFTSGLIVAEAKGFGRAMSETINLTTEDKSDIVVTMEAGATVNGRVVDHTGIAVAGAEIQNMQMYQFGIGSYGMGENQGLSGEDGSFTLTDQPVTLALNARKDGYAQSERINLTLKPGEIKSGVELNLRASESISGVVVKKDGSPIVSTSIQANGNNSYANARTDKDGKFELKNLASGVYTVYVYAGSINKNLENIKSGTSDLRIVIDDAERIKLIGTVIDDLTGKPPRDFTATGLSNIKKLSEPGKFEATELETNRGYSLTISIPDIGEQIFKISTSENQKIIEQTFRVGKNGVITGRVIEKASSKALAGVTVINWGNTQYYERRNGPVNHNVTSDDGTFTLAPAPSGKNVIEIRPQAPLIETFKSIEVKSEDIADLGDITIGVGGTIKGKVTDAAGKGIADKQVSINLYTQETNVSKRVNSDEDGSFEFSGLAAGSYSANCSSQNKTVPVAEGEIADVTFIIGSVKMTGQVLRGSTPVNASISANGTEGKSYTTYAQGGKYTLSDVAPGEYDFKVDNLREAVVVPDQAEFEKDFQLPNAGLKVTVTDATGQPVSEAKVTVALKNSESGVNLSWETRSKNQTTGADGTASFEGLSAGVYAVTAYKNEMGSASNPNVQLSNNQAGDVQLTLQGGGGTLVSVALKAGDGQPLTNAWCYLYGPDGLFGHGAQRGTDGVMTIKNIPPGNYRTNVSAWNYSQSERSVEIKAGETVTIEDVCYSAGSIQWILKKADGKPAAGANVSVTPINTEPVDHARTGVTDNNGNFEDRGMAQGSYQVTAQLPGKSPVSEVFEVKAGGHTKKDLTVQGW